ncbi:DUF4388 domain-containing protein [Malonomonas rubra]|uniref:DUF4388 domain-containing protein n=1 Tax=Malonomonas rubra TaxID=57040 RepID=UPI0026F0584B|nr:DUF4388 domain-containing protein [Malonomonas rubra]
MGLEGCLEDLGIAEILQIISLSKKSGKLSLREGEDSGTISFVDGQVVQAASTYYPETLGQLLKKAGVVSENQIEAALGKQQMLEPHQPLGALLSDSCQIAPEVIEEIVERQIEKIVFNFFTWSKGKFSFQLGDPSVIGTALLNPFDLLLDKGLSSHRLVVKGEHFAVGSEGEVAVDEVALESEIQQFEDRLEGQSLTLLRGMLAELDNPYIGGGIIMLILRYASELMNRAIVFDVRGRQLVGVGQFGLTSSSSAADEIVRKLRFEAEPGSLFARALQDKDVVYSKLNDSSSEKTLIKLLGGAADEVFLAPLVSDGRTVALIYGDNYPESGPIGEAREFEVFLTQAGFKMEQAL